MGPAGGRPNFEWAGGRYHLGCPVALPPEREHAVSGRGREQTRATSVDDPHAKPGPEQQGHLDWGMRTPWVFPPENRPKCREDRGSARWNILGPGLGIRP